MKVGLLICDEIQPAYQATFGDYPEMFRRLFPNYEFTLYDVRQGVFPENVAVHQVYMTTGSVHSAYEDVEWIERTKAFIRAIAESKSYFIGVCFGHQLLAEALGGKVEKAAVGWCVGVHQYSLIHLKSWMRPPKTRLQFLMMCQDQVVALPPKALRLAGSEACPNAIIQVGPRMLGIQGHPEFPKAYDKALMEARIDRMGAETVAKGIASMEQAIDTDLFRTWVTNFIAGK